MVTKSNGPDRIAELLAAYGSDLSRWSEEGRQAIQALSPDERSAKMRDDVAFDKLLAGAVKEAEQAPAPGALMARILEAAEKEVAAQDGTGEGEVVVLQSATVLGNDVNDPHRNRHRDWPAAAALLAASLVLGILVGSTEQGRSTAVGIGNLTGFNVMLPPVQTTALDEALQSQDDEDIL